VKCTPDKHCLVGEGGLPGSQNICANAGAFDSRNGMLNDDAFARKVLGGSPSMSTLDCDLYWLSPKLGVAPMKFL